MSVVHEMSKPSLWRKKKQQKKKTTKKKNKKKKKKTKQKNKQKKNKKKKKTKKKNKTKKNKITQFMEKRKSMSSAENLHSMLNISHGMRKDIQKRPRPHYISAQSHHGLLPFILQLQTNL